MNNSSKKQKIEIQKRSLIFALIGIIGLMVITIGVSISFFRYTKEGTTDNTIKTGTLSFLYTEVSKIGRGILIQDALPLENELGKVQTGEGKIFDFNIVSTTQSNVEIPYIVTARKSDSSNLDPSIVDLYLTNKTSSTVFLDVTRYSELPKYNNMDNERIIYSSTVPKNSNNANEYNQDFTLRMWVDENTKYSALKNDDGSFKLDENGNYVYPYNDQIFKITVNVYANGQLISNNNTTPSGPTTIYAGTNNGGYLQLGRQINLEDYQSGYTKDDVGLAYMKYEVDATGKITSVQGCLAASTTVDEVCMYTAGSDAYDKNMQIALDYYGIDETTFSTVCEISNGTEVYCNDGKLQLAFDNNPLGIWNVNRESNKTCLVYPDFGQYDCR